MACPDTPGETEPSVAVIVAGPTVMELVMVAVYVPFLLSVTAPIFSALSLEENVTVSPETGLAPAVTVAVAVLVEVPFATIEAGFIVTVTPVAGQVLWAV